MMNERNKITQVNNLEKKVLLAAKAEKVEMTLNTDSALTSGLLIQRLTELYEDPIEASVRETVSNAMDAVVTACSGRPTVKIYSPTALNPILIIKDNGVGMTYEDLKEIYAKYGASTKMNDLEQIGAYGLGAKAPLAYGSEFTVTSVKDGQKTTIIVAREEMTNFIKIIDSVLTDEPSGTTVSIPVSNSDTRRFQDQIDKYKQIPLDKDLDLYIDDELIENANYTLISDKVLIHEGKEKVYGRLWIDKAQIVNFVANLTVKEIKDTLKFVIGGWAYDSPVGRNKYYRRNNGIIVELKAGIVGFNSSRDSILENDRYKALEDLIGDYITSPQFIEDLAEATNALELLDFKKVVSEIISARRSLLKIEDGKMSIKTTTSYKSHPVILRTFDIEDFTHKETGFNFNDVLKNIPTISKQSVVIREKKDRYSKTAKNAIMDEALLYSVFSNTNVSEMNEMIDKIFFEGEVGSSLETLMFNLSTFIFDPNKTKNTNLTFITDVETEKHIKSLKAGRKSIVRMLNNNNDINYSSILVYTEHTKSEMNKMVEGLELENTVNLRIDTAEDMLELLKKYRAQNQAAEKKQQTELGTSFFKYDVSKNRIDSSNVNSVDKSKENLIVVTKSNGIDSSRLRMMHTWFCNENNLAEDKVDLYISLGQHTAVDIDILIGLSKNVMRDPRSDTAGRSKIYFEKVHNNKVELNAINNNTVSSSEKAFMRILTGIHKNSATMVSDDIEYKLKMAYEIAAIANFELPEFPTETLKAMKAYDSHSFSDMQSGGYYSNWGLDETSIAHLLSLVDKGQYELLQNLTLLTNKERLLIDKDGKYKLVYYGTVDTIQKGAVIEVYENKYGSNSYNQLLKAQTEAYLDFIKSVIKQMELVEF